jgi:hypothetical protein
MIDPAPFIETAERMSEGGRYRWWSDLATLLRQVPEQREQPPAAYVIDDYGRTLPVSWDMLRNRGGERIWLARAMEEPAEMDRLKAVLMEAYPLDDHE